MAHLLPTNFDLSQIEESEQKVVRELLSVMSDSWYVVPNIPITVNGKDREIDIALVSFEHGVHILEIKGGIITVSDGQWKSNNIPLQDPALQVTAALHNLVKRLRKMKIDTRAFRIHKYVVFPDINDFPADGAGTGCPREMVVTGQDLPYMETVVEHANRREASLVLSTEEIARLLRALRPDITEVEVNGQRIKGITTRVMETSSDRLGPVIGLDENKRVYLRGGAGTGKTFVAMRWARRALLRGESVLYVCYNALLGQDSARRIDDIAGHIENAPQHVAGSFHAVILSLMGGDAPVVPQNAEQDWWYTTLPETFREYVQDHPITFDTIIIDEGQDFRPLWLGIIENLMTDKDHGRLYMMADAGQTIYTSDWVPPTGITTLELTNNVRNSAHIGAIVERLGGAPVAHGSAPGPEVQFKTVSGLKEAKKQVLKSITFASEELHLPASQIIVLTPHRNLRDELIKEVQGEFVLGRWEDRSEDVIPCETIHRTKGLERNAVILVDMDENPDPTLTYVGVSRASAFLSIIGREALIKSVMPSD